MCDNSTQILLVEDSKVQASLVERAVAAIAGLELLHVASDGEEAMAFLRREEAVRLLRFLTIGLEPRQAVSPDAFPIFTKF